MKWVNYCILASTLMFSACTCFEEPVPPKVVYVGGDCPTFNKKLVLDITKVNDNSASITWDSVQQLKDFGEAKRAFNNAVLKLNEENHKQLNEYIKESKD